MNVRCPSRGLVVIGAMLGSGLATCVAAEPAGAPAQLAAVTVLGSRLRGADGAGPSPVSSYDRAFIDATGALTLADFLRFLPQNYTGIGAGRGSAPDELNPEFGKRTETTLPPFNVALGAADSPPGQTGVSGAGLRGLGSGSTLVLVDGRRLPDSGEGNLATDSRQGFVDLDTIPLGMIERVEVTTDGASAVYGADAVAGVINVVLKKNYNGAELSSTYRGTQEGGARERQITATTGFSRGRLRGMIAATYYDRADLKASQRAFSREQDHRTRQIGTDASGQPVFGRDLRLNWGYPAVVQAVAGNLTGILDSAGNPVRVALAPAGTDGRNLTPVQFIAGTIIPPGSTLTASRQRRGNTAEYLDLVSPSERRGVSGNFTYAFGDKLELYGRYLHSDTRGLFSTQPAVSAASLSSGFGSFSTVIPAAFNPFGQDVFVGLIHREFGSVTQTTHTRAQSAVLGARGRSAGDWRWDAALSWGQDRTDRTTRDFNAAAVTAALANPDPALRLNPFADARATGPRQAAIYDGLAAYTYQNSRGGLTSLDFSTDGPIFALPAGDAKLAAGGEISVAENDSVAWASLTPATATAQSGRRRAEAVFAEMQVPLVSQRHARRLLRRLDLHVAGRYEDQARAGTTANPKIGFSWTPVAALLVRGSYSTGFRAPDLTEYETADTSSTTTVVDPRRTPAATSGVVTTRGSNLHVKPETSRNEFSGVIFAPPFLKGLKLELNYYRTDQDGAIRVLTAQTFVNNEAAFPGRVTRSAPEATDTALGQPGRITAVDTTFVNFGRARNRSVDYRLDYDFPENALGRFRASVAASRTLAASFEVAPGQPARDDRGDTYAAPKWKAIGSVFWDRGSWSASMFASYMSSFESNRAGNPLATAESYAAFYTVDVHAGYRFVRGVWRGRGRGVRIGAGVGNVFNRSPPFSDTVFGFNGGLHSPLGRTYDLSLTLPF